jgi:hypothetical protein
VAVHYAAFCFNTPLRRSCIVCRSFNAAPRAHVCWHRCSPSSNIGSDNHQHQGHLGESTSIKMWSKREELKHTTDLLNVAFHLHDSVRNDDVSKHCLSAASGNVPGTT